MRKNVASSCKVEVATLAEQLYEKKKYLIECEGEKFIKI